MSDNNLAEIESVTLRFHCPKCNHTVFEEVLTDVVVSTSFSTVQYYASEDIAEPDYGDAENHGGQIDRYQCANCGHIVAKTCEEFRKWLKQVNNLPN